METCRDRSLLLTAILDPTDQQELSLISRASRGDVDAFSKLVSAHSALVRGVTLRMLGGQEAQDASQEVWVRVWANMKSFRADSAFSTWSSSCSDRKST